MENQKENLIVIKSFEFALDIIKYSEEIERLKKYNLSNQLFRSATSIGANINESQHSESRPDFIHKLKIASKEAAETGYWLKLCQRSESYPNCNHLLQQVDSISRILSKIISTSKSKL